MDTNLRTLLNDLGLNNYISHFEKNNVLNVERLQQIKNIPFLISKLIEPIGDLAILLSRLEEIKYSESVNSDQSSNQKEESVSVERQLIVSEAPPHCEEVPIVLEDNIEKILKTINANIIQPSTSNENQIADVTYQNSNKRSKTTSRNSKPKRVCKWTDSQEILQIDIKDLLINSNKGKTILKYYKNNKLLNYQCRSRLIELVGNKLLDLKANPSGNDFEQVDLKIREQFPSEAEYVYFIPAKTNGINQKNHEGKLPNYVRNLKHRNKKLLLREDVLNSDDSDENNVEVDFELEVTPDELNADGWLKENLEPWSEVEKKWKVTHKLRFDNFTSNKTINLPIYQYFETYRVLRLVKGYSLLEIDFELQYPNSVKALSSADWNLKREALLKLLTLESHSEEVKEIIENFKLFTDDQKDNLILQSVPYLFLNQPKYRNKKNKSVTPRPTQVECKESFILHVTTSNDIDPAIIRRVDQMKKGIKVQPFVLCVGSTRADLSKSYCIVDTVKYEFTKLKTALDVCFKAIFALNSEYSQEAYCPWLFVQQALYEIFTIHDRKNADISTMVGNFKALMNMQRANELKKKPFD